VWVGGCFGWDGVFIGMPFVLLLFVKKAGMITADENHSYRSIPADRCGLGKARW